MENPTLDLMKQIYDQMQNDPRMKGAVVDVVASRGLVTLTGTVPSTEAARAAEEIARAQPGVISVTNELKIV